MIELVRVQITYDGKLGHARWCIPPEAHSLGVTAADGRLSWHVRDDLGTPTGALTFAIYGRTAMDSAMAELSGAWNTARLF